MRWRLSIYTDRRREPREPVSSPEAEQGKQKLRAQAVSLEDEIRTVLLELEAGVYARDPNWRGHQS